MSSNRANCQERVPRNTLIAPNPRQAWLSEN